MDEPKGRESRVNALSAKIDYTFLDYLILEET